VHIMNLDDLENIVLPIMGTVIGILIGMLLVIAFAGDRDNGY